MTIKSQEVKNSEVTVKFNGKEIVLLVPVNKSKMSVVQSIKSKNTAKVKLAFIEGNKVLGEETIKKTTSDYAKLVRPYLEQVFGKDSDVQFTENNNLMTFDCGPDGIKKIWFNLNETDQGILLPAVVNTALTV